MSMITVERKHALGKELAKQKAEAGLVKATSQYKLKVKGEWDGDTYKIKSPGSGQCTVTDDTIKIEIDLPFWAAPWAADVTAKLNAELDALLKQPASPTIPPASK
jgi:putative polyhydroxyalkanoate system protein